MEVKLKKTEYFNTRISDEIYFGADQEWYKSLHQRLSGCGPTTAALIIRYLSLSRRPEKFNCGSDFIDKAGFEKLMELVWDYVTPRWRGVYNSGIFVNGIENFGKDIDVKIKCRALEIPGDNYIKPEYEKAEAFLTDSLSNDRPIAFLNLNNGEEKRLDLWHWVVLYAYNKYNNQAIICDNCAVREIDFHLWYKTTTLGGAIVSVDMES
ncbi:MAG: hypothetical protein GX222_06180 [Ruminococcaceae bacterium]|nr:hypothetical protein [Oscillospiraceae bacterium]